MNNVLKRKQVVFNLADPHQKKLFDYVEQLPNFSGYVKRLLIREMEGYSDMKKAPLSEGGGTDSKTDKALIQGFI